MNIMKRLTAMLFCLLLLFTVCACDNNTSVFATDEAIADTTFSKMINAIRSKDALELVNMFADSVKIKKELQSSAVDFLEYIQGEVTSFSTASEAGVGVDYQVENGKKTKEIQTSFSLKTTESVYYIAVKERVGGDAGLLSVYIIKAEDWEEDYVYRGDGLWIMGVSIE